MKLSDLRQLERHLKVQEAAKRLEREDIKGLTVQVIFEQSRGGPNDVPVQMFIPAEHEAFDSILSVVQGQIDSAKADAETKLQELSTKLTQK